METGMKFSRTIEVTEELTAAALGSGYVNVYATPYMIALMEDVSARCVQPALQEGKSTVGTCVHVRHLSATPVGMKVTCEAELIEIDRKRLVFSVKAFDEAGLIGEGTHERFIIDVDRFVEKTYDKLKHGQTARQ